ncbi:hypothetical protein HNP84_004140 [Thermocatellispora tengchongensis]|uniref:Uncharacterized protein n=1 Tax=Thermocatellispora tengchongensis TaxID=1073253 RepID=A0A840P417_9ACTN|nr:hypothetical protein [Thermocatellispora tengchongensis]MBB5134408.1 hypothetical protein [Thermocatellispora tengchongensis]
MTQAAPEPGGGAVAAGATADAVADLRATAKWTIAAMGAVGALLLGGGPIAAAGKIDAGWEAALASAGLLLALGGVAFAVWHTGNALLPRVALLGDLGRPELASLREVVERDPDAFYGPLGRSPQSLRDARVFHEKAAAAFAAALARETGEKRRRVLEQALKDAEANVALAVRLERRLVDLIHAWLVAEAVRAARIRTMAGVVAVALGAAAFLAATGGGEAAPAPSPTPTATPTATPTVSG